MADGVPVTSPPTAGAGVPPDWYLDPFVPGHVRWWDGHAWSAHSEPAPTPQADESLRWMLPVGRSGWAVAAGYVALLAMFAWPVGIVSLALGVYALHDIARRAVGPKPVAGRSRAWFAIVVGVAASVLMVVWLVR